MARCIPPDWLLAPAVLLLTTVGPVAGQVEAGPAGGVRFLLAASSPLGEPDASTVPVLGRRVSIDLTDGTLGEALHAVIEQADLEIVYSPRVVPVDAPLTLREKDITVLAALREILAGVAVDVSVSAGGSLAIVPRPALRSGPVVPDSGAISGRVTDSGSGAPSRARPWYSRGRVSVP
jgi:hypothetical protein